VPPCGIARIQDEAHRDALKVCPIHQNVPQWIRQLKDDRHAVGRLTSQQGGQFLQDVVHIQRNGCRFRALPERLHLSDQDRGLAERLQGGRQIGIRGRISSGVWRRFENGVLFQALHDTKEQRVWWVARIVALPRMTRLMRAQKRGRELAAGEGEAVGGGLDAVKDEMSTYVTVGRAQTMRDRCSLWTNR
jgi:hypothetical protein